MRSIVNEQVIVERNQIQLFYELTAKDGNDYGRPHGLRQDRLSLGLVTWNVSSALWWTLAPFQVTSLVYFDLCAMFGFDCSVHHYFCVNTLWFCPFWVLTRSQLRSRETFQRGIIAHFPPCGKQPGSKFAFLLGLQALLSYYLVHITYCYFMYQSLDMALIT